MFALFTLTLSFMDYTTCTMRCTRKSPPHTEVGGSAFVFDGADDMASVPTRCMETPMDRRKSSHVRDLSKLMISSVVVEKLLVVFAGRRALRMCPVLDFTETSRLAFSRIRESTRTTAAILPLLCKGDLGVKRKISAAAK